MDPNLFHLDWLQMFETLGAIVLLSIFIERSLALVFEHRSFIKTYQQRWQGQGVKEIIAYIVSLIVCIHWDFDAVSIIILAEHTSLLGKALTAGVIAGGSKGSIKLFRDVLNFKSQAYREYEESNLKIQKTPTDSKITTE
jgi:hypothetical protein